MKRASEVSVRDLVEDMIESFPERYREYLELESFFCDAHSRVYIRPGLAQGIAEKRFDELYRFFRFDYARTKFNTVFWAGSRIHTKAAA